MSIFFEMVKGFFFALSVAVGILFLRGEIILGGSYDSVKTFLMPGYLVFCGLMVGYLVSHIWLSSYDAPTLEQANAIYVKSFLLGIVTGVVLALAYMFL